MKLFLVLLLACFASASLMAQAPSMLTYQGRVTVNGTGFSGTGQFKFALVSTTGTTTYWSNDGTSSAGAQPTAAVSLSVSNGVYSVLLGDTTLTNMTAVPASVFTNADVRLRVWFNDGTNGWLQLTPDQRIASVGYAMVANSVNAAAVGSAQLASNLTLGGITTIGAGLAIPATSSPSSGVISQNGASILQSFGTDNFFVGKNAGNFTLTGSRNLALGSTALNSNTTGSSNTAIGDQVLFSNTTGSANTAIGDQALFSNTSGSANNAVGDGALYFNTTGNFNTALGVNALSANQTGNDNTAIGYRTLYNITGSSNTAIGSQALQYSTTDNSTAVGFRALFLNTSGNLNTAVGTSALSLNTTGNNNTAFGPNALYSNQIGSDSTAIGYRTLENSLAANNTAIGSQALYSNTTGTPNTAIGAGALYSNTTGGSNIAVGQNALYANTTGIGNIAVGTGAGSAQTTGSNSIYIGHPGSAAESNSIRIGVVGTHVRNIMGGIRGITTGSNNAINVLIDSNGQLGTVSSSARYKDDIQTMGDASARLLRLRPVTFRYKKTYDDGSKPVQFGLIAEEVAEVFPELAVFNDQGQPETVKYQDLAPILLNEFLKDHQRADAKDAEVAALQKKLRELQERDAARDQRERELEERLQRLEQALSRGGNPDASATIPETQK